MERNLLRFSYSALLLFLLLSPTNLFSQRINGLTVKFKDSVACSSDSYFLYTSVEVIPGKFESSWTDLIITTPVGWKLMGATPVKNIQLPRQSSFLPLTFIRTRFTPARWASVFIRFLDSTGCTLLDTSFKIKGPTLTDFQILPVEESVEIADSTQWVDISLLLKNTGTTTGFYDVTAKLASALVFNHRIPPLQPGKDTMLTFPIKLATFSKEDKYSIQIQVADSSQLVRGIPVEIIRRYTKKKVHPTPYKQFPISLDWGSFLVDKRIYQYAEIQSTLSLQQGEARILYRTKTFGQLKTVEKNVFLVELNKANYSISVGQLSTFSHFFAYGNGMHFTYKPNSLFELGIKGIFHQKNTGYTNNNFQLFIRHQHRDNGIRLSHQLHLDFDKAKRIYGYLFYNDFKWVRGDRWLVSFNIATGIEEFKRVRVFHSGDLGWSVGGYVNYQREKWQVNGEFRYVQKSFPGINKGFRMHQYEVLRGNKSLKYSLFYQSSFISSPLLLDTVYLVDAFKYNIEKIGLKSLFTLKHSEFNFSTGLLRQAGITGTQLPKYIFGEGYFNWRKNTDFAIQLSTITGYASKQIIDRSVWLLNATADIKFRKMGVKGFYVQSPFLRDSSTKIFMHYVQTYLLSPYASFRLFKNMKTLWRYSFSRSLFDKKTIHTVGFSLAYKNAKSDWQVQCSASIPFSAAVSNRAVTASYPYVILTLRKEFKVPTILKRQYHNLSVNVFEDLNANNQFDLGERSVPHMRFKVNQSNYETDVSGQFQLLNADTGQYTILLQHCPASKGLIAAAASTKIHLTKSVSLQIPVRRGYAISGVVALEVDPYSTRKYTPDNILIIVTADDGTRYTTLTDSSGQFYMPLPAGHYRVSLNQDAFTGSLQPLQLSFQVDLNSESISIVKFILRERRREIRMNSD